MAFLDFHASNFARPRGSSIPGREPVASPTVACLYREYNPRSSTTDGALLRPFTLVWASWKAFSASPIVYPDTKRGYQEAWVYDLRSAAKRTADYFFLGAVSGLRACGRGR